MDMVMSTYMMLLGMHAPWFLIAFMVVPMALAELILCSEIFRFYMNRTIPVGGILSKELPVSP